MKFIDFFAGIGGFRKGMELAGHECVGFCEFDKFATASYISMHLLVTKMKPMNSKWHLQIYAPSVIGCSQTLKKNGSRNVLISSLWQPVPVIILDGILTSRITSVLTVQMLGLRTKRRRN